MHNAPPMYDKYREANDSAHESLAKLISNDFSGFTDALKGHAVARRSYFNHDTSTHDGSKLSNSDIKLKDRPKQEEKNIAKVIYNLWGWGRNNPHPVFGAILDFEVPLTLPKVDATSDPSRAPIDKPYRAVDYKPRQAPYPRGKIDLLSVKGNTLYILELKRQNSSETYLRCILEAFTYLKTIKRHDEFISEAIQRFCLPTSISHIGICPIVFADTLCKPYNQSINRSSAIIAIEDAIRKDCAFNESVLFHAFTGEEQKLIDDKYNQMLSIARS